MRQQFNPSGLIIALIGFFLTRFTVTFAVADSLYSFAIGGVLPLVLGLSLAAFGVALALGAFEPWYVQTIAYWTVLGLGVVGALVAATVYGSGWDWGNGPGVTNLFANILIGGSVGGALVGVYAGQNKRYQRELLNRKNRLVVLNRLLHDEVMNAVTVINGFAPMLRDGDQADVDSVDAILEKTATIEKVMSSVRDLAEPGQEAEIRPIAVDEAIQRAVERAQERHPTATFEVENVPPDTSVCANHRLADVLYQLLVNGAEHADVSDPHVTVAATANEETVRLSVRDEGPGLPEQNREALERGTTIAAGDPTTGLGLYLVRLFVRAFSGSIETDVSPEGTTISLILKRDGDSLPNRWISSTATAEGGIDPRQLVPIVGLSLLAGGVMGLYVHFTTGSVPVIGALYGSENALVGTLTHEFYSVVFGLVYAGLLSLEPKTYRQSWTGRVGTGALWGLVLWAIASGVIMPLWLNLVGIIEPIPNLRLPSFVAHLLWGVTLGGADHLYTRWSQEVIRN